MTRQEVLDLAREVKTWKGRSYVGAARLFAMWILEVAEVEYHDLQAENRRLHDRCSEILEQLYEAKQEIERLRRSELPTDPVMRNK